MAKELDDWLASVDRGEYRALYSPEQPAAPSVPVPETSGVLRRTLGDTGVSALRGFISVPEAAVGLADIPTGGAVGRGLEKVGFRPKEAKAALEELYSPEQRAIRTGLTETKGFLPTAEYMLRHPSTIYHGVVESAPSVVAGGAAARGIRAATQIPAWAAGAAGEGLVGAGLSAEQIRQASETGYLTPQQSAAALASGVGTGVIGGIGGRVAQRYGLGDIETALAKGELPTKAAGKGAIRRIAEGAVTEGALEELPQSAQEQFWQNVAMGRPYDEGVAEAAATGLLTGGVMGGGVNLLSRAAPTPPAPKKLTPSERVSTPTLGMTPDLFTGEFRPSADPYQQAFEDAAREVSPGQAELFPTRAQAGLSETGKPLTFGVTTGAKPGAMPTMTRAEKQAAKKAERAAAPVEKPVRKTVWTDMQSTIDDHFASGRITEDQHIELSNDIATRGVKPAKLKKAIETAIAETTKVAPKAEVMPIEAATNALTTFSESLQGNQKKAFDLVRQAASNNELDKFISPTGEWQAQAIAESLGLKNRQAAHKAIRDLRKKLDSAAGVDVKAALAATTSAVRSYEAAEADRLGLSPAEQASIVSQEELFGSDEGATPGMGVIETVGGAQGAVGEAVAPPSYVESVELTERAVEAAREGRMKALVESAQNGDLAEAVNTWNDFVGALPGVEEISPKLPANEENIDFLSEWVNAYIDVRSEVEAHREAGKFIDEVGAYEHEVRRIVRERQRRAEKLVEAEPGRAKEALGEKPETGRGPTETGVVTGAAAAEEVKAKVTTKKRRQIKMAVGEAEVGENSKRVQDALSKAFFTPDRMNKLVTVVEDETSLPNGLRKVVLSVGGKVRGFVDDDSGRVYLISKNISKGEELSVLLHEVGVHLGMKNLVGEQNFATLVTQIQTWALDGQGQEGKLAQQARARVRAAEEKIGQDYTQEEFDEELMAYFVDLAVSSGVSPTAVEGKASQVRTWLKKFMDAVRAAIRKIGINPNILTAKDLVDLAYGAAHLEMSGNRTQFGEGARKYAIGPKHSVKEVNKDLFDSDALVRLHNKLGEIYDESDSPGDAYEMVMEDSSLSAKEKNLVRALFRDDMLGFDYPHQAVRLIIEDPDQLDLAPSTRGAISKVRRFSISEPTGRSTVTYTSEYAMKKAEKFLNKQGKYQTVSIAKTPEGTYEVTRIKKAMPKFSISAAPNAPVWERATGAVKEFMTNPANALKTHGLGWLTLTQLGDVAKDVNKAVPQYLKTTREMQSMSKEWVQKAAKIDVDWAKVTDSADMHDVMRESTRISFDPSKDVEAKTPEETALKQKYNGLTPEAKSVYEKARNYYAEMRNERRSVLLGILDSAYKERIDRAKESGDAAAVTAAEKELAKQRAKVDEAHQGVKGPYFPLMRLGDWYTVGMSKELAALEDKEDKTAEDRKKIAELRKDPDHYTTSSYSSKRLAQNAAQKLEGKYDTVRFNVAAIENQATKIVSAAGLQDVESYINSSFDKDTAAKIRDMMIELYYESLPEHHALKRELKREGVHGEETDMRRVFAVSSMKGSHYLSRMKYADDVRAALFEIKAEGKKDYEAQQVYNEVAKRAALSMDPSDTPWADKLVTASYLAHLGMNPAFVLTNATQVPMITMPWLAARSNLGATTRAVSAATSKAYELIKSSWNKQGWRFELDWDGKVSKGQADMLEEMLKRNLLDITMEHDLGAVAGEKNRTIGDWLRKGNLPVHITELANRAVTALAAYDLAVNQKKMSHEDAVDFAASAVSETQLDYSALNAPRHMQRVLGSAALARITMQFRKYQQGMLYLIGRSIQQAVSGSDAETKRIARRTLFGLATTTGVMAGSIGLPLAGSALWAASFVASLFGAPDDPWDAETEYKNWLAELLGVDAAEAVVKGLPAALLGLDLSKRVGLGDIAKPLPFLREGKTTQETTGNILTAAAGAPVGTIVNTVDGLVMMSQGDWAKGAEKVLPLKIAQNLVKAGRYEYEGMTKHNGEVVLPEDRFSAADIGLTAAGFQSTKASTYYEANAAVEEKKAAATEARNQLIKEYAVARMRGRSVSDIRREIAEFNKRHPEQGVRITMSALTRSIQARRRAEREHGESGVSTGKANRPYLEEAEFAG